MDDIRFDNLARLLARPVRRRRLLRRAAGAVAGAVLAGQAVRALAQECDQCLPSWQCCPPGGVPCCAATDTCCGPICCNQGYACVGGFCRACAPENRCGSTCCNDGQSCEDGECVDACEDGAASCGDACCTPGQTCEDGQCVAACPSGRARGRARCEPCPPGTTKCGDACCTADQVCAAPGACCSEDQVYCPGLNTCVLKCRPGTLNMVTCACECEGPRCGTECCPAGQECASPGGFGENEPHCCLKGQSCGIQCAGDPKWQCCRHGPEGIGLSCPAKTTICCGFTCCQRGKEHCDHGTCKRNKRKKHK